MEVLRLVPHASGGYLYVPVTDVSVAQGKEYSIVLTDENYTNEQEYTGVGDVVAGTEVVKWSTWPSRYDAEYLMTITGVGDTYPVVMDTLTIVRPYVDVEKEYQGKNLAEYLKYERAARLIIDSVTGGFYYTKKTFEKVSSGTDMLMFGYPVRKLIEVEENGEVVYSDSVDVYGYTLSRDGQYLTVSDAEDISEGRPLAIPTGHSDTFANYGWGVQFGDGSTYVITAEVGYPFVPSDIKQCATRIIDQLACGVPNYAQQYLKKYETDEFRIDLDPKAFSGTGDAVIDKILYRHWSRNLFHNIGVL